MAKRKMAKGDRQVRTWLKAHRAWMAEMKGAIRNLRRTDVLYRKNAAELALMIRANEVQIRCHEANLRRGEAMLRREVKKLGRMK